MEETGNAAETLPDRLDRSDSSAPARAASRVFARERRNLVPPLPRPRPGERFNSARGRSGKRAEQGGPVVAVRFDLAGVSFSGLGPRGPEVAARDGLGP